MNTGSRTDSGVERKNDRKGLKRCPWWRCRRARLATLYGIRDALDVQRPDVAALRDYVAGEVARWEAVRDGRAVTSVYSMY